MDETMRRFLLTGHQIARLSGLDLLQLIRSIRGIPAYVRDYLAIRKQAQRGDDSFQFAFPLPCFGDRFASNGTVSGHYFHQDLHVAQRVCQNAPRRHVDVGSRMDGFVAHLAAFREVEALDIRPIDNEIHNVRFLQADLMAALPENLEGYCDSLSCLHALEHFGLGRYGDPIAFDGHLTGLANLTKLLADEGTFYLSVPIGKQRLEFNGQRVFDLAYLTGLLSTNFSICHFSYVDDSGHFHRHVPLTADAKQSNYGCHYGCGIFELRKKPQSQLLAA